ncbi:MAG: ATP-binding cassette domain-containing protein [bacterium]
MAAAAAGLALLGGGCGAGDPPFGLSGQELLFSRGEIRVSLPAGHPLEALELRDGGGGLLLAQPVPPGQPATVRFDYRWSPAERLALAGRAGRAATFWRDIVAPRARPPAVEATLELPAGIAVPPGEVPLFVPSGSEASLALTLRNVSGSPLRLRVTLWPPPFLQPLGETATRDAGGWAPAGGREVRLDLHGQTGRVAYRFRVGSGQGLLRWRIAGEGLERPIEGQRPVAAMPAQKMRGAIRIARGGFPADEQAVPLPHRPGETLVFQPAAAVPLLAWLGRGGPRDPYRPAGFAHLTAQNRLAGDVVALVRHWIAARRGGPPLAAFGDPLLGKAGAAAAALVRIPAGESQTVALPVYFDEALAAPGAYWRCSEVAPWGMAEAGSRMCVPFRVVRSPLLGWLAIWAGTAAGLLVFLVGLARLGRWIGAFAMRDLALIALMAGLAFLLVSVPGMLLRTVTLLLLGPFNFLAEGLVFKGLLFLLLGCLFSLVRRPGAFFLFYTVWIVAQAALNGHTSPILVLFAGVTITLIEAGLWLGGVTHPLPGRRGGPPPWLWAGLAVGLAEALSVFWGMQLLKVFYRQFFADWFVLLQSATEGFYAALGMAVGLRVGRRLAALRRPMPPPARFLDDAEPAAPRGGTPDSATPAWAGEPPLLAVEGLGYGYGAAEPPVLRGLDFTVARGEILLLAGGSGSGKTTLLRLLKGLLPWPAEARVFFCGRPVSDFSPRAWAARAGLLLQEPALQVVRSTVAGEIAFGLDVQRRGLDSKVPGGDRDQRVAEMLRLFGLQHLADRPPHRLSGGELQKTALAAVLAPAPPLLLLDEPLAHLDQEGRADLLRRLRVLADEGYGVVIAEHRTGPILAVADRVLLLEAGRPPWLGGVEQFRHSPWNRAGRAALARFSGPSGRPGAPRRGGTATGTGTEAQTESGTGAAPAAADFREVAFRYGERERPVLECGSAVLESGTAVALTGPNGAGKTTLLTLLLGLRRADGGSVSVRGQPVERLGWPQKARLFGYLPQQAELVLQASTVADELAMALRWRGDGAAGAEKKVGHWLALLGLEHAAGRFPHLLSRGERQRLAMGAVMIAGPPLLVLDEPFAGQDEQHLAELLGLCEAFLDEEPGRSLIAATHDFAPVAGFFDRRWRLEDGRLTVERLTGGRPAAAPPPEPDSVLGGGA